MPCEQEQYCAPFRVYINLIKYIYVMYYRVQMHNMMPTDIAFIPRAAPSFQYT